MKKRIILGIEKANQVLWAILLIALPVTSFPFFPFPGFDRVVVRPLSMYPLLILIVTLILLHVLRGGDFPAVLIPLVLFVLVAIISTAVVYLGPTYALRGQTTTSRAVRAFATLGIGLGFFLVALLMMKSPQAIVRSYRFLYIAFMITCVWGMLQAASSLLGFPSFRFLNQIQTLISVRKMHQLRVHGFAFEPSWFASQINILILPVLWSGKLAGFRVLGKNRVANLVEWSFLGVLVLLLGLSYSRGGFVIGFGVLLAGIGMAFMIWRRQMQKKGSVRIRLTRKHGLVIAGGILVIVVVTFTVFIPLLSRYEYFTLMWEKLFVSRNLLDYILSIGGRPRLAYAEAGLNVFRAHPILGVGLGQAGFHMIDAMPNWVHLDTYEIMRMLSPTSGVFFNPKVLFVSLLSETGILGMIFFGLFMVMALVQGLKYFNLQNRFGRFMGMTAVLSWLSVLAGSYTLDSFATPNMWIAFGFMYTASWPGLLKAAEAME